MSTNAPIPAPTPASSPRWMKPLLILSLTANLVVIGFVIGQELRGDGRRGADRAVAWVLDMVPEDRRAMAEAHFAEALPALDAPNDDRGANVAMVLAAIRAEPYQPSELQAAMAKFGASRAERWAVLRERLSTLLTQFTPEERAAFAHNFEERMNRWRKRRND